MLKVNEVPEAVAAAAINMGPCDLVKSIESDHLRSDLALTSALVGLDGSPGATVSPEIVRDAPGRGGVRFGSHPINGSDASKPEVDQVFLAEVACASGLSYSGQTAVVHLPAAGMTLEMPGADSGLSVVDAGPDGMTVTTPDRETFHLRRPEGDSGTWSLDGSGSRSSGAHFEVTDEILGGLRFVKYGSSIATAGGSEVTAQTTRLSAQDLECVRQSLDVLDRAAPEFLAEIQEARLCIVPLIHQPGIARQSLSHHMLPGVVYSSITSPGEFIDLICHEYHHLKLFSVDDTYSLLARPSAPVLSPWRPQMRTAEGLLHAIYVFFQLSVLFNRIFEHLPASEAGIERMAIWLTCIDMGADLLARSDAQTTVYGKALMSSIEIGNSERLNTIQRTVGAQTITRIRQAVTDHLRQAGRPDSSTPPYLF